MPGTMRITMPFPPSTNTLFNNVGQRRRVPTKKYVAWRRLADSAMPFMGEARFLGSVNVRIDLVAPDRRRRDCDNYAKAVLDALVRAGVIADDSCVKRLSIGWEEAGEPCAVTITSVDRNAQ